MNMTPDYKIEIAMAEKANSNQFKYYYTIVLPMALVNWRTQQFLEVT